MSDINEKLIAEIGAYRKEIEELKLQLDQAQGNFSQKLQEIEPKIEIKEEENYDDNLDYYNTISIDENFGIRCINLSHTFVNIVCSAYGKGGAIYTLPQFLDTKVVPAGDLKKFWDSHPHFVENGIVGILNENFCRKYDVKIPAGVLTKEKLVQILENRLPANDLAELFRICPKHQREDLVRAIVEKINVDPNFYDMLFVSVMQRASGVNLMELAEEVKTHEAIRNGTYEEE